MSRSRSNEEVAFSEEELAALRNSIGPGMRVRRRRLGLTQEEAAEKLGISPEFYARVERGHALPSIRTLAKVCIELDVSADLLLGIDDKKEAPPPPPVEDPLPVRRLIRQLRSARPATLRLVGTVLAALRRAEEGGADGMDDEPMQDDAVDVPEPDIMERDPKPGN